MCSEWKSYWTLNHTSGTVSSASPVSPSGGVPLSEVVGVCIQQSRCQKPGHQGCLVAMLCGTECVYCINACIIESVKIYTVSSN